METIVNKTFKVNELNCEVVSSSHNGKIVTLQFFSIENGKREDGAVVTAISEENFNSLIPDNRKKEYGIN